MTNWLWLFLAFYILVGQPAILGRMLDNCSLYELAWLNAGIFIIAWIISAMCKSPKKQTKAESITSQLLWENAEGNSGSWVAVVKVQETTVKEIEVAKVDIKENLPQPEATPEENIQSNIAENNIHENIAEENREEVKEKGYQSFVIPDDIGGRYSFMTPAHLFPLALNHNLDEIVKGYYRGKRLGDYAYQYAVIRNCLFKEGKVVENFCVYDENMQPFTE